MEHEALYHGKLNWWLKELKQPTLPTADMDLVHLDHGIMVTGREVKPSTQGRKKRKSLRRALTGETDLRKDEVRLMHKLHSQVLELSNNKYQCKVCRKELSRYFMLLHIKQYTCFKVKRSGRRRKDATCKAPSFLQKPN